MISAKKVLKGLLALLLLGAVGFGIVGVVDTYMTKARESEAKTQLASFYTATQAFYAEYKEYSADPAKIGYSPEGRLRWKLYFNVDEVPSEILSKLPPETKPFFEKNGYRVLAASEESSVIFTMDHNKVLQRFELK